VSSGINWRSDFFEQHPPPNLPLEKGEEIKFASLRLFSLGFSPARFSRGRLGGGFIHNHTINWAHFYTVRRIIIMFAANAGVGIYLVVFAVHGNGITWAFRYAHITVNATGIYAH